MSKLTIPELLTVRAGFARMKQKLHAAGYDVSGVKYLTDIPAVLCDIVPEGEENVMAEIKAMLGEELVEQLMDSLGAAASRGALVRVFEACTPTEYVKEGDLDA